MTPLAKLLEAALFASARPIPSDELAALDPEAPRAAVLALRAQIMWTELIQKGAEPWQVLSTLLGLLEMAKVGELRVNQPRPFANVEISRDVAVEAA